jgi:hypothetical protein
MIYEIYLLLNVCVPYALVILAIMIRPFSLRVPLVEQELLTLPEHMSSPPAFSGVRVTQSLVLYVCFHQQRYRHSDSNKSVAFLE